LSVVLLAVQKDSEKVESWALKMVLKLGVLSVVVKAAWKVVMLVYFVEQAKVDSLVDLLV
jgi:hypothetical protein